MKHDDAVFFKGIKDGLWLILDDQIDYTALIDRLHEKLSETTDFFIGAKVIVNTGRRKMQPIQYHSISDILQKEYGLVLLRWDVNDQQEVSKEHMEPADPSAVDYRAQETLIVYRTVRSGQQINHEGSVLVLGDVNPGAAIIAGGDITVLGVCRGTAHAGASGNTRAIVAAFRLQATQLRIASLVACAPDGENAPEYPEVACIKDGEVVIRSANLR